MTDCMKDRAGLVRFQFVFMILGIPPSAVASSSQEHDDKVVLGERDSRRVRKAEERRASYTLRKCGFSNGREPESPTSESDLHYPELTQSAFRWSPK